LQENPPDNDFEECMRQELIPANEIGVTFSDIGALDIVKESLQEAVMFPLRRPNLFKGDGILNGDYFSIFYKLRAVTPN
jgi:ATP-dependent 26S proteasome regulatory subunit